MAGDGLRLRRQTAAMLLQTALVLPTPDPWVLLGLGLAILLWRRLRPWQGQKRASRE
jgi:hypothetical protein